MRLILTFLLGLTVSGAMAQTDEATIDDVRAERDLFFEAANAAATRAAELETELQAYTVRDPSAADVIDQYHQAQIDHYQYEQSLRKHTLAVLNWQLVAGYLILLLVIGIASLGVYLSYREVIGGLRKPTDKQDLVRSDAMQTALDGANTQEKTELILSLQKIQVTSAVTGVVILVLSLGFLYLFVERVFSLDPTNLSRPEQQIATNASIDESTAESTQVQTDDAN